MSPKIVLEALQTERRNPRSSNIDQVTTAELCKIINDEDTTIATAVQKCIPTIAAAIDALEIRGRKGGRVIYVGAGTSGRLGVLDASEIPPTFSASPNQFIALIAGGDDALRYAQEGAEDDTQAAENDLKRLDLNGDLDTLVGIAASGRTPYVLRCLSFAKSLGCATVGIACAHPSTMENEGFVDHMISVVAGPEVITGSTRMKAGTATKLVLNMLSSGLMIRLGKTYGNMMIDVRATNRKLQERSRNIIRTVCGPLGPTTDDELDGLLAACDGSVKLAVAVTLLETTVHEAAGKLKSVNGVLADILRNSSTTSPNTTNGNSDDPDTLVLAVDAGGSKCAAVVLGKNGEVGRGESGECNVSSIGVEAATTKISHVIQQAVDSIPTIRGKPFTSINFSSVRIGLAGFDRHQIAQKFRSGMIDISHQSLGKNLVIGNDIDFLVSHLAFREDVASVVVLVAGTGSIAMSYERDEYGMGFHRTGRSGGWGPQLGDDGSGYAIGREAIRYALEQVDMRTTRDASQNSVGPLARKVFQHFGLDIDTNPESNLLNSVLLPDAKNKDQSLTRRIADVAKVVLEAVGSIDMANVIADKGCQALAKTAMRLLRDSHIVPGTSTFVLSGGLMQSAVYRNMFLKALSGGGVVFKDIQVLDDPAMLVAQSLLEMT